MLPVLFEAMSRPGGFFGADLIPHFNGDLFRPDDDFLPLNHADLGILHSAAQHDWSTVEPAIFGTLFERSLDAAKRSMIGAHYTSTEDILLLVEPVVMDPLRRRWATVQQSILDALAEEAAAESATTPGTPPSPAAPSSPPGAPSSPTASSSVKVGSQKFRAVSIRPPALKLDRPALVLLQDWAAELSRVRIFDPACGSGNFLYVALKRLLDLWHEARVFGLAHGLTLAVDPIPHPGQLFGIEIDFYAHEIASIVVWIGFLQWKHDHGVKDQKEPLLQKLTNIEHADAILRYDASAKSEKYPNGKPYEPTWPPADFIIGNPPFLGDKLMRRELGDVHVSELRKLYDGRVPGGADLVAYWFEKTRKLIEEHEQVRAGLLATQGIRGGANRKVLERIVESGSIFMAWSDRPWILEGAAVQISILGFDSGSDPSKTLDGKPVLQIHANLTSESKTTSAFVLSENVGLCFIGPAPHGRFDINSDLALRMLSAPLNVNGRPNSDVIRPVANAIDLVRTPRNVWTIDFGSTMPASEAAAYELPFEFVRSTIYPERKDNRRLAYKDKWWLYGEARPGMRKAIAPLSRFIASPRVSKHRLFVWCSPNILCNDATVVFARDDDYFFGVLHSQVHELWALALGTQLEDRPRYTPNSTFDTFPFPWPPGTEPSEADSPIVRAIADAARELVRLRDNWLNPKDAAGEPLPESDLKDRTLTKLYNARPQWLANAHTALDRAVFAAYGWPEDPATLPKQDILARLLALNHQRAAAQPTKPRKSKRAPKFVGKSEKSGS